MNRSDLEERISEAYRTCRALPDPDRKFLYAKLASWPHFVREMSEGYGWHSVSVPKIPPSPGAIDRMDEVLGWFARHLADHKKGATALWLTFGRGLSLSQVGRIMGLHRDTVAKRRNVAVDLLISRLSCVKPEWVGRIHLHSPN